MASACWPLGGSKLGSLCKSHASNPKFDQTEQRYRAHLDPQLNTWCKLLNPNKNNKNRSCITDSFYVSSFDNLNSNHHYNDVLVVTQHISHTFGLILDKVTNYTHIGLIDGFYRPASHLIQLQCHTNTQLHLNFDHDPLSVTFQLPPQFLVKHPPNPQTNPFNNIYLPSQTQPSKLLYKIHIPILRYHTTTHEATTKIYYPHPKDWVEAQKHNHANIYYHDAQTNI